MADMGLGSGLTALAFWGFIASIIIGGMWYSIRTKEAQQETLRRMIESGRPVDHELADKLLSVGEGSPHLDRDLRVAAVLSLPTAAGLGLFGVVLGIQYPEALTPLLGAAVLLACIGVGLLVAARMVAREKRDR
jgi:hypothetical protein